MQLYVYDKIKNKIKKETEVMKLHDFFSFQDMFLHKHQRHIEFCLNSLCDTSKLKHWTNIEWKEWKWEKL